VNVMIDIAICVAPARSLISAYREKYVWFSCDTRRSFTGTQNLNIVTIFWKSLWMSLKIRHQAPLCYLAVYPCWPEGVSFRGGMEVEHVSHNSPIADHKYFNVTVHYNFITNTHELSFLFLLRSIILLNYL